MSEELEPPYPTILNRLRQGHVIPFLGSGASLGGRAPGAQWREGITGFLPTASELASYLARMTQFPPGEAIELATVAQYYDVVNGRDVLDEVLREIFNNSYSLTSLHAFLARIPVPLLIVTTNYDDCIERAFDAEGKPYDLVTHTTDVAMGDQLLWYQHGNPEPHEVIPNKFVIDLATRPVIYKMHGSVDRRGSMRDQFLITEDDYVEFLSRMTKNSAIPSIFAEPFQRRHFLFLGYSLRDWNLRVVLNRIEKDLRRRRGIKSWAIRWNVTPLERCFWKERGVSAYNMTIEDFVSQLEIIQQQKNGS
jgi:hypothetical protein